MSWWRRLWKDETAEAPLQKQPPADGDTASLSSQSTAHEPGISEADQKEQLQLERLRLLGHAGGATPTEALAMLRRRTGTLAQAAAVQALAHGLLHHKEKTEASDALRVAVARLLDEAGQAQRAARLLSTTQAPAARMFCADLHARDGKLPLALSLIERVLAQDIDLPGAKERRERWAAQLGLTERRAQAHSAGATVLTLPDNSHSLRLLREVARGGAATIYEAEDENLGRRAAYKVYHRGSDDRQQIEREARLCHRFAGRSVVRVFDAHPEEGWLAMEWMRGGSLHRPNPSLKAEVLVHDWLPEILLALRRVHGGDHVHADVKPANILLRASGEAVLSDFGICTAVGTPALAGTPGYISPERLAGAAACKSDDIYAIGRILEDRLRDSKRRAIAIGAARRRTLQDLAECFVAEARERPKDAAEALRLFRSAQDAGHFLG